MSDEYWEPVEGDDTRAVVKGVYTSIATYRFEDDTGDATFLETRVFTFDGAEHHLLWPIEAALPLLSAIMNLGLTVLGTPGIMGDGQAPDDVSGLLDNDAPWDQRDTRDGDDT